jgi:hypothetical protein
MAYFSHYKWGWDVQVVSSEFGIVTYKNVPKVGDVVYPYGDPMDSYTPEGWACVVTSYDPLADGGAGRIVVEHQISEADVYAVKGVDTDGMTFVLSAIDVEAGTFQIHKSDPTTGYNGEISGRTLLFEITVLNIT